MTPSSAPRRPVSRRLSGLAVLAALGLLAAAGPAAQAQTARKPSPYENMSRPLRPDELVVQPTDDAKRGGPAFLNQIANQAEFQQLARVYNPGTPLEIPHVLFVIDRQQGDRIYYLNTPRYSLHENFARERRLLPAGDKATLIAQYKDPQRRLLFGTLSWQRDLPGYTYEFWEGDRLTPELLQLTQQKVQASFYEPVRFKANSTLHEQVAKSAGLDAVTQESLLREQTFLPLNTGAAQGRLRIVKSVDDTPDIAPTDILVLDEVPVALPPVAGLVTQRPSTLLSHVNLLAKGWRIPNAYVRDAVAALREHDGQWVELTVTSSGYQLRRIAKPEAAPAPKPAARQLPKPDLTVQTIKPLSGMATRDSRHCGVKAANLGALKSALPPAATVPDGFCIPFAQYAAFMAQLHVAERVAALEQRPDFAGDANVRRAELAALRQDIVQAQPDPALAAAWRERWQKQLQGRGVFVRSSSNSEDLPGFSGAGLYTTVPNVTQADALAQAVQTVWASVYNFEAYEARRAAGIGNDAVVMGGAGAAGGAFRQFRRDDHARSLRRQPPLRHLHLGQARPGHQGGRGQAPGRTGDVFQLVQGGPGADPVRGGHPTGAGRRGRRARSADRRRAPGPERRAGGPTGRGRRPGQAAPGRRGPGHRVGRGGRQDPDPAGPAVRGR
jgi:hypothetical protein